MPQETGAPPPRSSSSLHSEVFHKDLSQGQVFSKSFASLPTPQDLALINTHAKKALAADQVYVGEAKMANDQLDRDGERFNAKLLERFAATLPGKKFLLDHIKKGLGHGRFYKAWMETEQGVKWLVARFYIPVRERTKEVIEALEDGLADTMSLGFKAKLTSMKGADGKSLVPEYQDSPDAEALEGSLVWLGAQYDARVKEPGNRQMERITMKVFGKEYELPDLPGQFVSDMRETEGKLAKTEGELSKATTVLKELGVKDLEDKPALEQLKAMKSDAEAGRAYRKSIEDEIVKVAGILKVFDTAKPEEVEKYRTTLTGLNIEQLKSQRAAFEKLVPPTDRLDAHAGGEKKPNAGTPGQSREKALTAAAFSV